MEISDPIDSFNLAISSTKSFLQDTIQQQASDLISIKEVLEQQGELVKSLAEMVEKSSTSSNPHGLTDSSWPPLLQSGAPPLHAGSGAGLRPSQLSSPAFSQLLQCVSLTSKLILINYGPLAPDN